MTSSKNPPEPGLRSLLNLDDPRTFLEQHWPDRHMVVNGPLERLAGFAGIPAADDVETLLGLEHTYCRADFRSATQFFSVESPSREEALNLYRAGFTLYLYNVQSPTFSAWQEALTRELSLPPGGVVITAFASRPGAGSRAHFDAQENFMVQVRGRKRWRIAPNRHVAYPSDNYFAGTEPNTTIRQQVTEPLPKAMPDDALTVELEPGSVMYLPRGYWHETDTVEDSLHWVVQAQVPVWSDVLQFVLKHSGLMHGLDWRTPVVGAWRDGVPSGSLLQGLGERLRVLGEQLGQARLEDLLGASVATDVQQELAQAIQSSRPTLKPPAEGRS